MLIVAVAYWFNSRPKQEIDLSQLDKPQISENSSIDPKEFVLKDRQGRSVRLSDFKGKPILLNFWASWCPPCVDELPSLLKFAEVAKKQFGLETIAVSVDTEWKAIDGLFLEKKFWPRGALPLTILLNADGQVAESYGTSKYPETYFIDRNFKIVRKFVGPQNWTSQEIVQWIAERSIK